MLQNASEGRCELDPSGELRMFLSVVSSFRSPESVEMDEIMAAMVLTSLSCSPVVQSPPQTDPGPGLTHLSSARLQILHPL